MAAQNESEACTAGERVRIDGDGMETHEGDLC